MHKHHYKRLKLIVGFSFPIFLLLISGCQSEYEGIWNSGISRSPHVETFILHIGYRSHHGGFGLKFKPCKIYISDHFQVIGADQHLILSQLEYDRQDANSDYIRAGKIKYCGSLVGSMTLPESMEGDMIRSFDITDFVHKNPSKTYFVAIGAPSPVGVLAWIEKIKVDGQSLTGETMVYSYAAYEKSWDFEKMGPIFIEMRVPAPLSHVISK